MTSKVLFIRPSPKKVTEFVKVKSRFKAVCARQGVSMTDAVICFMEGAAAGKGWAREALEEVRQ